MNALTLLEAMYANAGMDLCFMKTNMTARKVKSSMAEKLILKKLLEYILSYACILIFAPVLRL